MKFTESGPEMWLDKAYEKEQTCTQQSACALVSIAAALIQIRDELRKLNEKKETP